MQDETIHRPNESGTALISMVMLLLPLVVAIGTFSMTMTGRTDRLQAEIGDERTLLAAESGLDDAIYRARTGTLADGVDFASTLGPDLSFHVAPTYLGGDLADNDDDGFVDEADEDVFQLLITGSYRDTQRRLAAYLGPTNVIGNLQSAFTIHNPDVVISLKGTPLLTGYNHDIDGSGGNAADDTTGLSIAPPGTVAGLQGELTPAEGSKVTGVGGSPSLGACTAVDLETIVQEVKNSAGIVLTNNKYSSYDFGDASTGTGHITYREGEVRFAGNSRGAGILVVTDDLRIVGNFRFDGIIVVLGDFENGAGTAEVYGAVVQGEDGENITAKGTLDIRWSKEAIDFANSLGNRYVAFNGWQELSRH